jgi:hypothetical protein
MITEELWLECQKLKRTSGNATGKSGTALLSGLCRCAECGSPARKAIKTGRIRKNGTRGRWETLVCSKGANNAGCPYIGISYEKILTAVLDSIRMVEYEHPTDDSLSEITNLRMYISHRKDELNDAYEFSLKTKTVDARERYRKLAVEIDELKETLRQLESKPSATTLAIQDRALNEIFQNRKPTNANLRKVIKTVQVDFRSREIFIETHLGNKLTQKIESRMDDAL